jgi:hypothetical protein
VDGALQLSLALVLCARSRGRASAGPGALAALHRLHQLDDAVVAFRTAIRRAR